MMVQDVQVPVVEVTYVGGPTAVIEIDGLRFITDPTFDAEGGEYPVNPVVKLKKTKGPAISSEKLGKVDVVLLSHDQHPDNLDREGRALLGKVSQVFTTRVGAERLGNGAIGLNPWESRTVKTPHGNEIRITATPARHGPVGIEKITGDVVGFVLTWVRAGTDLLYVTGDTVWFGGVAEVAKRFHPRALLLFTGAAQPRGPFSVTMDTNDAVETAAAFADSLIVPVHCEGWAHFTQGQEEIRQTFTALGLASRLRLLVTEGKLRL